MKIKLLFILLISALFFSCNKDDVNQIEFKRYITAKDELAKVLEKAKNDFSSDAKLSGVYGRNVNNEGKIDLLDPQNQMFFYSMQSNEKYSNEFYIPVYAAGPVKSPVQISQITEAVKDENTAAILTEALKGLAKVAIDENLNWIDSPEALRVSNENGGINFIGPNQDSKIEMILIPSVNLQNRNIEASTIWIVNYHSENSSLILLIDAVNGKFIGKF